MAEKKQSNPLIIAVVLLFILIAATYAYLYYNKTSSGELSQSEVEINLKKINTSNLDTSLFKDKQFTNLKVDNLAETSEPRKGNAKPFVE